ncbi:MAG: hydrogen gas-evolving membrane-bound hydrogenase subunit E [Halapricum sp.]
MQPNQWILAAVLVLPFLAAASVPLLYRVLGERTAYYAAAIAAVCFGLVGYLAVTDVHGLFAWQWIDAAGFTASFSFYVDGLSLLVAFLASGIGILIFVYSGGYMHDEPGKMKFYATLLAFMGSMLGVAFAADLVALFVFWELTSISSFVLIGHYTDSTDSQYAARKSMLITVAGGLFMLLGFLLLYAISPQVTESGRATFLLLGPDSLMAHAGAVRTALEQSGLFVPALILIGIGAAAKSAQVPLHIWLPDAMEAPTPVSAFLHSATMVKAGVYLVGRFRPLMGTTDWQLLFVVLGLVTMTIAAILAVAAEDVKELLAYSTASHLGLIIAGFGIVSAGAGVYGAETGAFHILNHAAFKAALFLVAGIIAHEAGTRLIDDLGGLWRDLPIAAGVTVVAALGMAGVPPFNGFYSKELLFESTYELAHAWGGLWWLLPVVAVFGSVFTFLYSIRFLMLFFGEKPDALGEVHTPSWSMRLPALVLAIVAGIIGLGGITAAFGYDIGPLTHFVERVVAATSLHGGEAAAHGTEAATHGFSYSVPTELTVPTLMSAITIGIGIVAYQFYGQLRDGIRWLRAIPVLSANWYYDTAVEGVDRSRLVDNRIDTGLLRTYALALLLTVSAMTLLAYGATSVALPTFTSFATSVPMMIVLGVALVAALAVTRAPSHIAGVLTLSILGFMVAIFYILGDAPDLALTQLLIETLVLVIFLLVLDKLPSFYGEARSWLLARDAVVSAVVGITVFLTVLVTTGADPSNRIAQFFVENGGVPAEHPSFFTAFGGGSNVVNVILVDFRAFDTMGEISVISMAALSVITLIAMRERGETQ